MPIRTVPIDPEAPVPTPETDSVGRPRWTMPLDRMVFLIICALEIGSIFMIIGIFIYTKQPPWLFAVAIGAILIGPGIILAARLTVTLDEHRLRWVFFPFWRGSVPYDTIENVEICTLDAIRDFGGWGPKFVKGHTGLIAASGRGVVITRSDKKRKLVISCTEPESLTLELLRRVVVDDEPAAGDGSV